MAKYKAPALILQNPLLSIPNMELFKQVMDNFVPENSIVIIGTKDVNISTHSEIVDNFKQVRTFPNHFDNSVIPMPKLDLLESIYSTIFTIYEIPPIIVKYWKSLIPTNDSHLPKYNIITPDKRRFNKLTNYGLSKPTLVNPMNISTVEVWVFPHGYKESPPTVTVRCELRSKDIKGDINSAGTN